MVVRNVQNNMNKKESNQIKAMPLETIEPIGNRALIRKDE